MHNSKTSKRTFIPIFYLLRSTHKSNNPKPATGNGFITLAKNLNIVFKFFHLNLQFVFQ